MKPKQDMFLEKLTFKKEQDTGHVIHVMLHHGPSPSPDVTLGPPVLVLQQVGPGGAVTPDHVTDDEEERDQAQTKKLE